MRVARIVAVAGAFASLLPFWLPGPALAQEPERRIKQNVIQAWDEGDGLPMNTVGAVAQSADGYLWLGQETGLVRFDGARFEMSEFPGMPSADRQVRALTTDGSGDLWAALEGTGLWQYRNGVFESMPPSTGLASMLVTCLAGDGSGGVWVGTEGHGLLRVHGDTVVSFEDGEGRPPPRIMSLAPSRSGGPWVGTRESGLLKLREDRMRPVPGAERLADQEVLSLTEDGKGTLWIGLRSGLSRLTEGALERVGARTNGPADPVMSMAVADDGALWLGTLGGGLFRYHEGVFERLTSEDGFPEDDIRALSPGGRGEIWVGTKTRGLAVVRQGAVLPLTEREGLSQGPVLPILEDRAGGIWIGTFGGGLNYLSDGEITTYSAADGLSDPFVLALAQDSAGSIWIGTRSGVFRLRNDRFRRRIPEPGAPAFPTLVLHVDRKGELWAGGPLGVIRFDPGSDQGPRPEPDASGHVIFSILEARDGTMWFGTRGGGLKGLRGGQIRVIGLEQGLDSNQVLSLHEDADGSLWVGTTGGLSHMSDGEIRTVTRHEGLPAGAILRILEDDDSDLWVSTNRGVFQLFRETLDAVLEGRMDSLVYRAYTDAQGMPSREANGGIHPAGWQASDGRLWFPTVAGVAIIDPEGTDEEQPLAPVLIQNLVVAGKKLRVPRSPDDPLSLDPGPGRVSFHFTVPEFRGPEAVIFQHRLIGLDDAWENASNGRQAAYTNLSPGSYRFMVRARRPGGPWSATTASASFTVQPFFYETWWFLLMTGIAVLALAYGGHRVRVRALARRERQLQRSSDRLELALQGGDLGMWDWNVETGKAVYNRRWATMLGYNLDEIEPHVNAWKKLLHPDDLPGVMEVLNEHLEGHTPAYETRHRMRTKAGDWTWVLDKGKVVERAADGSALRAVGTHLDVTRRMELEDQLRQAQKMEAVGQLTGGIAHDFNNVLSVVLLNAQLVAEAMDTGEMPSESDVAGIEAAARKASALTQQLLGFGRRAELNPVPTDLARVAREMAPMLETLLPESIRIVVRADETPRAVDVDPSSVEQMLLNLATNARDAMSEGGTLDIEVEEVELDEAYAAGRPYVESGPYVCVSVTDTGVGMDEETQARVFEPFFTTKEPGKGTGLGLAMVFGLTKQQGGHVHLYSEPGQGTSFKLYFPVTEAEARDPAGRGEGAERAAGGTETILLAEDEDAVRDTGRRVLERYGYTVLEAANGREAIEVYRASADEIDLVVSDLVMPELGGAELYETLQEEEAPPPIILASGYSGGEARKSRGLPESVPFLHKPWTLNDLLGLVREVLDGTI